MKPSVVIESLRLTYDTLYMGEQFKAMLNGAFKSRSEQEQTELTRFLFDGFTFHNVMLWQPHKDWYIADVKEFLALYATHFDESDNLTHYEMIHDFFKQLATYTAEMLKEPPSKYDWPYWFLTLYLRPAMAAPKTVETPPVTAQHTQAGAPHGDDVIAGLRRAMESAGVPIDFQANLIGYFCNEWNELAAAKAKSADEPEAVRAEFEALAQQLGIYTCNFERWTDEQAKYRASVGEPVVVGDYVSLVLQDCWKMHLASHTSRSVSPAVRELARLALEVAPMLSLDWPAASEKLRNAANALVPPDVEDDPE